MGGNVKQTQDAKKSRLGPEEALALARQAGRVVAARGKKLVTFDLAKDNPDDETLLGVLLGPSGNLRAPAAIVGRTLVVGFAPDVYRDVLTQVTLLRPISHFFRRFGERMSRELAHGESPRGV